MCLIPIREFTGDCRRGHASFRKNPILIRMVKNLYEDLIKLNITTDCERCEFFIILSGCQSGIPCVIWDVIQLVIYLFVSALLTFLLIINKSQKLSPKNVITLSTLFYFLLRFLRFSTKIVSVN